MSKLDHRAIKTLYVPPLPAVPWLHLPTARAATTAIVRMRSSRFIADTSTLLACTIAGQLIAFCSAPVLGRLYAPADFGTFGLITAFVAAMSTASCLNYELALPTPTSEAQAVSLAAGAAIIGVASGVILAAIFATIVWFDLLGYGALPPWAAVIIWVYLTVTALVAIFQYWSIRRQRFKLIGEVTVTQNAVRAVVQICAGFTGSHWVGLVVGEIGGRAANLFRYLTAFVRDVAAARTSITRNSISTALTQYRRFPVVLLPAMFGDQVVASVPIPLITMTFGLAAGGQYFLMRRVIDMPVALVSRTVADAFYGRISEHAREQPGRVRPFLLKVFSTIVVPSTLAFLPVFFVGPAIFATVFGEPWRQAGRFAALMVPALVMNLAVSPVSRVFAVTSRPGLRYVYTATNITGTGLVFGLVWLRKLDLIGAVAGLAMSSFASYAVYLVAAYIAAGEIARDVSTCSEAR